MASGMHATISSRRFCLCVCSVWTDHAYRHSYICHWDRRFTRAVETEVKREEGLVVSSTDSQLGVRDQNISALALCFRHRNCRVTAFARTVSEKEQRHKPCKVNTPCLN